MASLKKKTIYQTKNNFIVVSLQRATMEGNLPGVSNMLEKFDEIMADAEADVQTSASNGISLVNLDEIEDSESGVIADGELGANHLEENDDIMLVENEDLISRHAKRTLGEKGITQFTDIQRQALRPVLEGRDMIARSRTGTGKTIAFGLPIVERMAKDVEDGVHELRRGRGPRLLVMAPTRELARQVNDELTQLARPHRLFTAVFHGGSAYGPQEGALRNGIDILVATPGRIMDHLDRGNLRLDGVKHIVLDEADEMLDMGFAKDIEHIVDFVDIENAQMCLFSATTPSWIMSMAKKWLKDPLRLDAVGNNQQRTATTVAHKALLVPSDYGLRANLLEDVITVELKNPDAKAIVFTQTKRDADELATGSAFRVLSTGVLHGDLTQKQRDVTLNNFKRGKFRVLVATDVAARGIDISGIDLVLQYQMPQNSDSYVHRAGRTGRAGKLGTSIVMHTQRDERSLKQLEYQIGNGFKFERHSSPTPQSVMKAAADNALNSLETVDDNVVDFFRDSATTLLSGIGTKGALSSVDEGETGTLGIPNFGVDDDLRSVPALDVQEIVARCLALASGKTTLRSWSLQTGQTDMITVLIEAPRPLKHNDVLFAVSKLAEHSNVDSSCVGKISLCENPKTAVFDLPSADAFRLVKFAQQQNLEKFRFEIATELPRLQTFSGGRNGYRSGGNERRGAGRGGGYRGNNGRRGNGHSGSRRYDSSGGRDSYGGENRRQQYSRGGYSDSRGGYSGSRGGRSGGKRGSTGRYD